MAIIIIDYLLLLAIILKSIFPKSKQKTKIGYFSFRPLHTLIHLQMDHLQKQIMIKTNWKKYLRDSRLDPQKSIIEWNEIQNTKCHTVQYLQRANNLDFLAFWNTRCSENVRKSKEKSYFVASFDGAYFISIIFKEEILK